MKNNIKKAPVKFWEDLLYFQHFMQIFVLPQIRDYHHLKTDGTEFSIANNIYCIVHLAFEILQTF